MTRAEIGTGPSKLDFMLSLFDGNVASRRKIIFCLCFQWNDSESLRSFVGSFDIIINSATRTLGEEDYLFSGKMFYGNKKVAAISGSYSTQTRKGWAEFLDSVTENDIKERISL